MQYSIHCFGIYNGRSSSSSTIVLPNTKSNRLALNCPKEMEQNEFPKAKIYIDGNSLLHKCIKDLLSREGWYPSKERYRWVSRKDTNMPKASMTQDTNK